jgi:hypothetical protein
MFDFNEPIGFAIFCDDIRDEVSGKISLIGIYHSLMVIHGPFPATLPKFGFFIEILEPAKLILERDFPIELSIYLPGDEEGKPSIHNILPPDPVAAKEELASLPWEPTRPLLAHITLKWIIAPFHLKESGTIRILAGYKDDQIRCGSLQVIHESALHDQPDHPRAST